MKKEKFTKPVLFGMLTFGTLIQCKKMDLITLPSAKKEHFEHTIHGDVRVDNYQWLRLSDEEKNAENPSEKTKEVFAYLEAENAYFDKEFEHTKQFQEDLFQEMKARIKEDDSSVPYKKNGYFYITRYEKGDQYPIYARKKETLEAPEGNYYQCQ